MEINFIPVWIGRFSFPIAYAIVSSSDFDKLNEYRWTIGNGGYPKIKVSNKHVSMHSLILEKSPQQVIDHINGNPLDNRRENLRVCTQKENSRNRAKYSTNKSGYKGVSWDKAKKAYRSVIMVDGKQIYLGIFDCPIAAAQAYNNAARVYHAKYSVVNEVKPEHCMTPDEVRLSRRMRSNKTGIKGITKIERGGKEVGYCVRKNGIYLGYHKSIEEAKNVLNSFIKKGVEK